MEEKHRKLPYKKTYPWNAQVNVEMPIQLGRERRILHATGEKTLEFLPHKTRPNHAYLKMTNLDITFSGTDLVLAQGDSLWKKPIRIPEITLNIDDIKPESCTGFVDLETGRFTLQFEILITPKFAPIMKQYGIDEVPILVQEVGQLDLDEGTDYHSRFRFTVAPGYQGEFKIFGLCIKGPRKPKKPPCGTSTWINATMDGSRPDGPGGSVLACPGDPVHLFWKSSGDVREAEITPDVGAVSPTDDKIVYPTTDTEYTIHVIGDCEKKDSIRVRVIEAGDEIDICANPISRSDHWEYEMPLTQCSRNIKVTSIMPICAPNCYYTPIMEWTYLDCRDYLCFGSWAGWKEDPDGHIHTFTVNLFRIDLPEYPLAGIWKFWPLGIQYWKPEGTANFRTTVKC